MRNLMCQKVKMTHLILKIFYCFSVHTRDAALAIAKYVGGTVDNFVVMMNNKAKEIGMTNTTFNNPSGLDEEKGNYSTAYDMAILTSYAMKNKDFAKIVGTKTHTVKTNANVYSWTNKNKLLFSKT